MIDDGIRGGDYIVVEARDDIRDGQTVVAEVDGQPTVRRFYGHAHGRVRLEPANERVLPLVIRSDRVRVRGVLVGVLRKHGFRSWRPAFRPTITGDRGSTPEPVACDLRLRIMEHNVAEWERLMDAACLNPAMFPAPSLRALGQNLHALQTTYAGTESPRLQRVLVREADRISRAMQRAAARLGWRDSHLLALIPLSDQPARN
jgi:hypothetical protein